MRREEIDSAAEDPDNYGVISDGDHEQRIETLPGRWRCYYENISAAIRGNAQVDVKPEQTRRVMVVFEAAFESARTGQAVRIEADGTK
jgi:predicted dehydrogenase